MHRNLRSLAALVLYGACSVSLACTTAVVSGRATPDGRPLLWKNRDTSERKNEVVRIEDGRYSLVAVVNAGSRSSVWMGVNEAGLCIENSVCKDLTFPEGVKGVGNGGFMLSVLKDCATVAEVKSFLERTDETGRSTCGNFGVIDAHGGAALFEAARNTHRMFDANDPETAPHGCIVRSNFSLTGQKFDCAPTGEMLDGLYSGERYLRGDAILATAAAAKALDVRLLIRHAARDMSAADGMPHCGSVNGPAGALPDFIPTKNTISRTTTVSFAVFQGVRPGEDPLLTTMWVGMGDPKFTAAVPCWAGAGSVCEELTGAKNSPLCAAAGELRSAFYTKEQNGVRTAGLPEVWDELWLIEDEVLARVAASLEKWRKEGINPAAMQAIHVSSAEQTLAAIRRMTNQTRTKAAAATATN